jgi:orotate phosphoribosyltransferase
MTPPPKKDGPSVDADVREKIHLEILKRTGAYLTNDHILLPSGHHGVEYIDKTLVTTEPSFTEGLGAVIAKHYAEWPLDVVLSTGNVASVLAHCVARAHPSKPILLYANKNQIGGKRKVSLHAEFHQFIKEGTKVLIVEDLITMGATLRLMVTLVEQLGGKVVGIGCLWQRNEKLDVAGKPIFSLVKRRFPIYDPASCPLCKAGIPLREEFAKRRQERRPSSVKEEHP